MSKHSVLIIDNNSHTLFSSSQILERNQYNVTLALNGGTGIDCIRENTFSLILSEFALEDATALTILETARGADPDTTVIFQTLPVDPAFKEESFKLGADDYLFKPYQAEELLFRVKKNIACYELRKKIRSKKSLFTSCCVCKKIRSDDNGPGAGRWREVEDFLKEEMDILLSSTYCPKCAHTVHEGLMTQLDRLKAEKVGRYSQKRS